ncbi:MAG TPA: SIMPL domain-containing protein [Sphingomonas sp.]|jgi:hypothetical protein|uniref:SIMPL domain-containing protein n=1 Tax=Sphingomonas sp. TaxID=28214 RepID=UPI002EDB5471
MRSGLLCLSLALALAAPLSAQVAGRDAPTIQVVGSGSVSTIPDRAQIDYWVTGEGKTADDAALALNAKQRAISGGFSRLLGTRMQLTGGNVIMIEARDPRCARQDGYDNRPTLSEGNCVVTGYVATLQGSVRTERIDKAATAVGLAGRLGARDARLQSFQLGDDKPARRAAMADAIANARAQAEALATAAGAKLGPVIMIRDQQNMTRFDVVATGSRAAPVMSAPAPAPISIDVAPRPIDTRAEVYVTYAIVN